MIEVDMVCLDRNSENKKEIFRGQARTKVRQSLGVKRRFTRLSAIATALGLAFATAMPARGADLLSLYQQAIENDARLSGERFRYRADQQRIVQSRSGLRPQIGVSGDYGHSRNDVSGTNEGDDDYNFDNLSFSVSQPLFDRRARATVERSKGEVQLSALVLNDVRQDVALRLSRAYFDILAARDNLEVARSEMSAISRQLDLAREMLEVGLGTKTDLFDTEARFKLAEVSEIEALNDIEDARRSLQAITGIEPEVLAPLSDDAPVEPADPPEIDFWISLGLARSLSVLQSDQAAEVARLQTEVNRLERSPTVDLVFNDRRSDTEITNTRKSRDLSLLLNVPIYQGGGISSRVEEAHLRYQAALEDAKQVRRETERQIRTAFLDVESNSRRIVALQQAVSASESAVQAREEGFAAGISTNLDVLDAQRDLFAARRDYLRARYDHIINLLALERAAGSLEDENIGRINEWLDINGDASLGSPIGRGIAVADELAPTTDANENIEETAATTAAVAAPVTALSIPRASTATTIQSAIEHTDLPVDNTLGSSVAVVNDEPRKTDAAQPNPADLLRIPVLNNIVYQDLSDDSMRIDIKMIGPFVRSYSFGFIEPLRLAVDLYDVAQGMPDPLLTVNNNVVESIEAEQDGDHTRVIMNLKRPVRFDNSAYPAGIAVVLRAADESPMARHLQSDK